MKLNEIYDESALEYFFSIDLSVIPVHNMLKCPNNHMG